ncbi:MAG: hypothetical protein ABIN91_10950 [Mucilaginibacter sp.]|uniref:hypothetical protein n=1 Tax=Mucilaginibacter sp. TaxID=1882438 RepID=UPI003266EC84
MAQLAHKKPNHDRLKIAHNALDRMIGKLNFVKVQDCDLIDGVYYVNYTLTSAFSAPDDLSVEISQADFKNWILSIEVNYWQAYHIGMSGEVESYETHEADLDQFLSDNNSISDNYGIMKEYLEDIIS